MKKQATMIVFWLLIVSAVIAMLWGAVHIQRLDKSELAVYTQSEYDAMQEKYEKAQADYGETSRQLVGYMTKYESIVTQLLGARRDIERLRGREETLSADLETALSENAALKQQQETLSAQLTAASQRADDAESALRKMNTTHAEDGLRIRQLEKQLEVLRVFESAALPVGLHIPDDCSAAEVGGWVYISRRDHKAQAVLRRFLTEDGTDRPAIVAYLLSLTPEEDGELTPAVSEFTFEGGVGSRFAMQYTDEDGTEMYGEFCVLEIGEEFFCMEIQAEFPLRESASHMTDALLEGLYATAQ